MKKVLVIIGLTFVQNSLAQNQVNFSQYMVNQGVFNPAYFDDELKLSASLYYRNQWSGVDGAPSTFSLSSIYKIGNHGIHLNALSDRITVINNNQVSLGYNYIARLSKKHALSFGVNASFGKFSARYNELMLASNSDLVFQNRVDAMFVNFAAGVYYQSEHFFVGLCSPNLFNNRLKNSGSLIETGFEKIHYYGFIGGKFGNETLQIAPTGMVKAVAGAPLQADIDLNFLYKDLLWFGVGGRTEGTLKFSLGLLFAKNFKLIYNFDAPFIAKYRSSFGSHEITLSYGNSFYSNKFSKRKYLTKKALWKRKIKM